MVNTNLCLEILDNQFASLQNSIRLAADYDRQTLIFCQTHLYAHTCKNSPSDRQQLHGSALIYFQAVSGLNSQSTSATILVVYNGHATIQSRASVASATSAWNSISRSTRSSASLNIFRSHLKTELFQLSYL